MKMGTMNRRLLFLLAGLGLGNGTMTLPAAEPGWPVSFPGHWSMEGRVTPQVSADSVTLRNGFAQSKEKWSDCEFSFRARTPKEAEQVQIWAGIRGRDRDSRYIFGLRGGDNNDVYLARYAPDGDDKFLGVAPLDFKPVPGTWYKLRAVARGNRFQVYVNDETLPRINAVDDAPLWKEGSVSLGGGWLQAEFSNVVVKEAAAAHDDDTQVWQPPKQADQEARRARERAAYQPATVEHLGPDRTEVSLDGKWLFMPDQDLGGKQPAAADYDDGKWHVMEVPALWTPCLSWLYGERGWKLRDEASTSKGLCDKLREAEQDRLNNCTFDWKQTKAAWYRHEVGLPPSVAGRHVELDFDAIAKVAQVWVNGTPVGSHTGMFGELKCDLTSVIKPGKNVIAVHVVGVPDKQSQDNRVVGVAVTVEVTSAMIHSLPHGMMRDESGGIWQPVKLVVTQPVAVNDVSIRPKLDGADFDVELRNGDAGPRQAEIGYVIRAVKDGSVFFTAPRRVPISVPASGMQTLTLSTPVLAPKLWSPSEPNLYTLEVQVYSGGQVVDRQTTTFGFRTFTVDKERLLLNGKPYWLRGANHFPSALEPNNAELARKFLRLAHDGNVRATRTHAAPWTETWLKAADETGMGISYEGTWPWLMLKGPPPDAELLKAWKDEFASLLHKYRNHPSILMWTVNNEMKFPGLDKDNPAMLQKKWPVLSDMIKTMRRIDPTRPIVADSSYTRKSVEKEYNDLIKPNGYDDGDIDDVHAYFGWYEPSCFHFFQGELGAKLAWPGRPMISQEMSTGYPRNDDGHPVRFYLFTKQSPQAWVGGEAYENRDPAIFLRQQCFLTKELAEALRRSERADCSGIFHFAYTTWFKDVWNVDTIQPFVTYYGLQKALQPVLVSAELHGRHFYAGSTAHRRVCVANDADDSRDLPEGTLKWEINVNGTTLTQGSAPVPAVAYYENKWLDVDFKMPEALPSPRVGAQLLLKLEAGGKTVSQNDYDITLATGDWAANGLATVAGKITVFDPDHKADKALAGFSFAALHSLDDLRTGSPEILIVGDAGAALGQGQAGEKLKQFVSGGGKVLLLHAGKKLVGLFPDQVKSYKATGYGDVVTMRIPESPVFDGLEPLDMEWFELGPQTPPVACGGYYQIDRARDDVLALADHCDQHGGLDKPGEMAAIGGPPIVEIHLGAGRVLASEMTLEAAPDDPIARRVLRNMLLSLAK